MDAVLHQSDIFERAAECERAVEQIADPQRRVVLGMLREMWIAIGNESPYLSPSMLDEQVGLLEKIHLSALASARSRPGAA
jgi:hypothetical protein